MVNNEPVGAGVLLDDVVSAINAAKKGAEGHFVPVKITFMHRS
jgi:ribosomal protein L11